MTRPAKPLCTFSIVSVVSFLAFSPGAALAQSAAKPPKPDLHAGGARPSAIPNGVTTEVLLPGFHLSGAQVDVGPICKLDSYKVASDTEIRMQIRATRKIEDKEDTCDINVRTAGGKASTWIVVDFTEAEQAEVDARQHSEDRQKAAAFQNRSGKTWHLTFAGGATVTYSSTGANPDGMPTFQSSSGTSVQIAVTNDNRVTFLESGCMRSGTLVGNKVSNGQSMGQCSPSGSWTATMEH